MDILFQDDNAFVHRSRLFSAYKEENNINTTLWPAQSPNINIIEYIWLNLKRNLQCTRNTIDSKDQLIAEVTLILAKPTGRSYSPAVRQNSNPSTRSN